MTMEELKALPVPDIADKECALFMWATCPRLNLAFSLIRSWGFHYRGVAFIWVKTRKDGGWIHGQGVPPTATKPTSELCLIATTNKKGRPHPLLNAAVPQVVPAPRTGKHSEKPKVFYDHIESLYGKHIPRIELFARNTREGWDSWGNEI